MKKIKEKSAYWIRENFARYRINSMIFNLVTFLLIFVVFGFIAYVSINERIFDESKNEVVSYVEKLNSKTYDIYSKLKSPDPRMTIIYYYSDEDILPGHGIPQLDTYIVGGNEKLNEGIDLDLNGATYQKFVEEKVDGNNYLVYYTTANFPIDLIENKTHNFKTVYRVKIYMNVDGEVNSKKELIVTYAISVAFILVICIGVSYFMMQKATKPIGEFVDKHISFISDASHELRTPLAVIQSKLENIMTNLDTTIYDNLEDLAVVLNEVSRLSRLTSELLLLTRNDQNSVTLDMEIVNLDKVLEEIIEPFKELMLMIQLI